MHQISEREILLVAISISQLAQSREGGGYVSACTGQPPTKHTYIKQNVGKG